MKKFLKVASFKIKRIQMDNRSEFAGSFEKFVQSKGIIHFYNYPKDPQSNAYIERFNRTIQEQFVEWYLNYLLFYNTKKPHFSLKKTSPLDYF